MALDFSNDADLIDIVVPGATQVITIAVPGIQGPPGALTVGTVTTGAAGSNAAISVRTLTNGTQVADFTIPRGDVGAQGIQGDQGIQGVKGDQGIQGTAGPSNTLTIGTVTTGAAGSSAAATVTGTSPNQTLNLTVPQGIQGIQGNVGPAGTITGATATGLAAGATPTVTLGGTTTARTFAFGIPAGAAGPANTLTIGTVTTGAAGSSATASITGTAPTQTLNLTIPTGPQGPAGAGAPDATTIAKGSIMLAGDLAGTAALPTVPGLAGKANTTHTHVVTDLSNSTAIGRSVLTAADATAVRTAIGAGTSSLTIGTTSTTAMAGNKTFTAADVGAVAKSGDTMTGTLTIQNLATGLKIPTASLVNAYIVGASDNALQDPFPSLYHDILAFNRHWGAPTFQTSADGTTAWTNATRNDALFSQKEHSSYSGTIDGTAVKGGRWTWNSSQVAYSTVQWLVVGFTYDGNFTTKEVKVESSADGVTWTTRHLSTHGTVGMPVWHSITDWGGHEWVRLTLRTTTVGGIPISAIRFLTPRWGDQGGGSEYELPYTWDESRSVTFERAYSNNTTPPGPTELTRRDYVDAQIATRAATNHTHTAANISDSTTVGRSVLTAVDATAARTAIGAGTGTSNLVIGTTAGTAAAGNDSRLSDARAPLAHTHAIADLTATGTRDATTYLRGDGTWAVPAGGSGGSVTAANITDATVIGRTVLTSADAAAVRSAIGAGTGSSNLAIGTTSTTAKAGDYSPPADAVATTASMRTLGTGALQAAAGNDSRLSDARTPLAHTHTAANISDSTTVGRSVLTAVDAAAARTAIGAGTGSSNLVLGTTAGTAKDGAYQPTAANISDATVTGRSVLTAIDAAAARTAIGAGTGTSNLTIGTTSSTAKAGDYAPPTATTAVSGTVTLATSAEATTGTDALKAITPATLKTVADTKAASSHTHTAANISDSSTVGRSVLTAVDAAAARTAIGAITSTAASETVVGIVELATAAETTTGTSTALAVHPAGLKVELDKKANVTTLSASMEGIKIHDGTAGGGTRPTGFARVRWVNPAGTTYARPTNMITGDIWERD